MKILGHAVPFTSADWMITRAAARLGIITATLSGIALGFHVGGGGGYALPLSYLLGYPTNLAMRLIPGFRLASTGSASEWSLNHVAWCAAIACNWTLVGVVIDVVRWASPSRPSPTPIEPSESGTMLSAASRDPLLEEFATLERAVEIRERENERSGHRAA